MRLLPLPATHHTVCCCVLLCVAALLVRFIQAAFGVECVSCELSKQERVRACAVVVDCSCDARTHERTNAHRHARGTAGRQAGRRNESFFSFVQRASGKLDCIVAAGGLVGWLVA